jgi:hypothetical protein
MINAMSIEVDPVHSDEAGQMVIRVRLTRAGISIEIPEAAVTGLDSLPLVLDDNCLDQILIPGFVEILEFDFDRVRDLAADGLDLGVGLVLEFGLEHAPDGVPRVAGPEFFSGLGSQLVLGAGRRLLHRK